MLSSQSANTVIPPAFMIAFAVAIKVFEGNITSFPSTSNALKISSNAAVPLLQLTAKSLPV